MSSTPSDPKQVLAALSRRAIALELSTLDLCFLAALHLRGTAAQLTAFDEDQLIDIFEQVCALDGAAPEAPKQRATPAIRRLRDQRLLARIDGAGVLRAGEYALTRLASGIVEFFLQDEALTHESLTLLTRSLLGSLADVLAAARAATSSKDTWRSGVVGPLRVTVFDLVSGIERRQRGFDLQQQEFQRQIAELLEADWFGALDRCQELLEATSATLRELNQVLLHDMHEVQTSLQDVQELAVAQAQPEAEQATRAVGDQIDRIVAWGSARQRAWSEYYQYVHRYLRDVVRLDPSRTLVHRLREQLAGRRGRRFGLKVAAAPGIRL
ncbi:MAG TPA: condensin subunit MukF, partial [Polyangiaceae bacterium]|nr:condensin subunit MukF [Polyangiaceae bacterium]